MSTHIPRTTAKIYEFPRKLAASGARTGDHALAGAKLPRAMAVEFGSGWYHDAAVQEADRVRKP